MTLRPEDRAPLSVRPRSLPRRTTIEVDVGGRKSTVLMGTRVGDVLPAEQDGALVVAALVDRRAMSLDAPLLADALVEPLSTRSWEGREVVRRSAGLLVLEAASRVAPDVLVRIGPSLSSAQVIETPDVRDPAELERLSRALQTEVRDLAARDIAFIEEVWAVDEAITHFGRRGWDDAVAVLQYWRDPNVPLATCGSVYVLSLAPLLARAGLLDDVATLQRELTVEILRTAPGSGDVEAAIDRWSAANAAALERYLAMVADIRTARSYDVTTLPVALRELSRLLAGGPLVAG